MKLGEGLSRQRREGAGTTWAWGSLVWVGVGVHLRQDTGFESSGRPLKQATEHRETLSLPLAPATLGAPCRLTLGRGHLEGN